MPLIPRKRKYDKVYELESGTGHKVTLTAVAWRSTEENKEIEENKENKENNNYYEICDSICNKPYAIPYKLRDFFKKT